MSLSVMSLIVKHFLANSSGLHMVSFHHIGVREM